MENVMDNLVNLYATKKLARLYACAADNFDAYMERIETVVAYVNAYNNHLITEDETMEQVAKA